MGLYSRDGPNKSDIGIVKLHPPNGTHWVLYIQGYYFDSYGCAPPQKLSKFTTKGNGYCLYSEYRTQSLTNRRDSYCASYCLYIFYLTKMLGLDVKFAVLPLYYQKLS